MPIPIAAAIGGISTLYNLGKSVIAGGKAKKAERGLEDMAKNYKPNASIIDFYTKAFNKYNPNAYTSQGYQQETNQIQRNLATGLNAAQSRRGGLAAVGALVQGSNDAGARAAARAEGQQAQALGQLGQATQMKAQEDFKPFEMRYNLLSAKAGGQRQVQNQSAQNAFTSAMATATMLGEQDEDKMFADKYGSQGAGAQDYARNNGMNFNQYNRTLNKRLSNFKIY